MNVDTNRYIYPKPLQGCRSALPYSWGRLGYKSYNDNTDGKYFQFETMSCINSQWRILGMLKKAGTSATWKHACILLKVCPTPLQGPLHRCCFLLDGRNLWMLYRTLGQMGRLSRETWPVFRLLISVDLRGRELYNETVSQLGWGQREGSVLKYIHIQPPLVYVLRRIGDCIAPMGGFIPLLNSRTMRSVLVP